MDRERTARRHSESPYQEERDSLLRSVYRDVEPAVTLLSNNLASPKTQSEVFQLLRERAPRIQHTRSITAALDLGIINRRFSDDRLVNSPGYTRQIPLPGFDSEELLREKRNIPLEFPVEGGVLFEATPKSDE